MADLRLLSPDQAAYKSNEHRFKQQIYDRAAQEARAMGCMVVEDLNTGKVYPVGCYENAEIELLDHEQVPQICRMPKISNG